VTNLVGHREPAPDGIKLLSDRYHALFAIEITRVLTRQTRTFSVRVDFFGLFETKFKDFSYDELEINRDQIGGISDGLTEITSTNPKFPD
jgi:hypothetical protein